MRISGLAAWAVLPVFRFGDVIMDFVPGPETNLLEVRSYWRGNTFLVHELRMVSKSVNLWKVYTGE